VSFANATLALESSSLFLLLFCYNIVLPDLCFEHAHDLLCILDVTHILSLQLIDIVDAFQLVAYKSDTSDVS